MSPLMPTLSLRPLCALALAITLAAPSFAQVAPAVAPVAPQKPSGEGGLPAGTAAGGGFVPDRLVRLHGRLDRFVSDGDIAGAVSLIARRGRIVDVHVTGLRDREQRLPMTRDTIVRVYSMTKIATTVAALVLLEEGRLRLDDQVATFLPSLKAPRVFVGGTAAAPKFEPAARPITIRHLLTHTSGYTYGLQSSTVDDLYRGAALFESRTGDEFVGKVATLPLIAHPGDRFNYGVNTDLLGVIIEKVTGQSLGAFMQARIFAPLGMVDTGFGVPAAKRARLAQVYQREGTGPLTSMGQPNPLPGRADRIPYPDPDDRLFHSGGGGLFSTADDYARFAQMLLDGGVLDGVRILGRKTVATMTSNQTARLPKGTPSHQGFGFGVSVRLDQGGGTAAGSVGEFGWSGAATTLVSIDPQERIVSILLTQHMPFDQPRIFAVYSTMVNAALD